MNATQIKKAKGNRQEAAASNKQREAVGADLHIRPFRGLLRAFTLPEMLVTIGVVAIVVAVALPAFYSIRESFNSNGADTLVSAALSTAKAMAAKEQKYVGVRFQCVPDPEDPTKPGDQYIVFIVHDPGKTKLANGFRAAYGIEPLKLPTNQGVIDMTITKTRYPVNQGYMPSAEYELGKEPSENYDNVILSNDPKLWDMTSFSIIFSPSGRLLTHAVRIRNSDGIPDPPAPTEESLDIVFNAMAKVTAGAAMFYQDDYFAGMPVASTLGLGPESSRKSILIYDKRDFKKYATGSPWSSYLKTLSENGRLYINPYTGTIIENQNRRNAMK